MKMCHSFFFCLMAVTCAYTRALEDVGVQRQQAYDRPVEERSTHSLHLDNAYDGPNAGKWGPVEFCPEGSYVRGLEVKYKMPGYFQDEKAITQVKLFCTNAINGTEGEEYITSLYGLQGKSMGKKACRKGPVSGFKGRVLPHQGVFGDDVGIHDLVLQCDHSTTVIDSGIPADANKKFEQGTWSFLSECQIDEFVCGIQTKFEVDIPFTDETSVNDVILFCCD